MIVAITLRKLVYTRTTKRICYASSLGGCSAKLSREHYISESVLKQIGLGLDLERRDQIGNISWNRRSPQSMTAKILCERHNSVLSPLDKAGAALFHTINALENELADNRDMRRPFHSKLDGHATERWLLKCAFGLCFGSQLQNTTTETPIRFIRNQDQLLRVLFGADSPGTQMKLYVECEEGNPFSNEAALGFQALSHGEELWGLRLALRSVPLLLAFGEADRLVPELCRPRTLKFERFDEPGTAQVIEFLWHNHIGADLSFTRVGSTTVQPFPQNLPSEGV